MVDGLDIFPFLLALHLFQRFELFLACDAAASEGERIQARVTDRTAAFLANAVGAGIQAVKRFVELVSRSISGFEEREPLVAHAASQGRVFGIGHRFIPHALLPHAISLKRFIDLSLNGLTLLDQHPPQGLRTPVVGLHLQNVPL